MNSNLKRFSYSWLAVYPAMLSFRAQRVANNNNNTKAYANPTHTHTHRHIACIKLIPTQKKQTKNHFCSQLLLKTFIKKQQLHWHCHVVVLVAVMVWCSLSIWHSLPFISNGSFERQTLSLAMVLIYMLCASQHASQRWELSKNKQNITFLKESWKVSKSMKIISGSEWVRSY